MGIRRWFVWPPLVLALVLAQSYFWVPTYDEQARGNPGRLEEFIHASIGDASILNPILSADSASSEINGLVFEGLIDRDENLRFRGRVAESWTLSEEAYFHVGERARPPGAPAPGPEGAAALLQAARAHPEAFAPAAAAALANIVSVEVEPGRTFETRRRVAAGPAPAEVTVRVAAPPRVKLRLREVDQDLFPRLAEILGSELFASFDAPAHVATTPGVPESELRLMAEDLLPAVEHNPVLEFRLRPGVTFHDGHAVSARDVRFTYDAIMDPRNLSPRVADYEPVKAVEVVDPLTVRIVYKRLYSPAVGTWAIGLLPAHRLDAEALRREAELAGADPAGFGLRQSGFNRNPVGCGPFVFREWKSDQYIELERFEPYWEGAPGYRRYAYRIVPDLLTQEMEFYAGTLDSYAVQPHQVARLREDPRFQSFSGTSYSYSYIAYNLRRPPLDDPRVRRALGMAINAEEIIRYVLYDQGERTTGPFLQQTEYYDRSIAPLPCDPEGALRLLSEAGWQRNGEGLLEKDGRRLRFTLITNSGNDTRKAVLAIAQDAWRRIGVDVRTDLVEWSVFIKERVNKLDFDALVLGWSMGVDPDLYQIWHSSQTGPHQLNFIGYRNPEADELIVRIRREYDFERRVALCHRLHAVIARDQPYTFLYAGKWTAVLDRRIVVREPGGGYRRITPTRTGSYMFDFNRWIKLAEAPRFEKQ